MDNTFEFYQIVGKPLVQTHFRETIAKLTDDFSPGYNSWIVDDELYVNWQEHGLLQLNSGGTGGTQTPFYKLRFHDIKHHETSHLILFFLCPLKLLVFSSRHIPLFGIRLFEWLSAAFGPEHTFHHLPLYRDDVWAFANSAPTKSLSVLRENGVIEQATQAPKNFSRYPLIQAKLWFYPTKPSKFFPQSAQVVYMDANRFSFAPEMFGLWFDYMGHLSSNLTEFNKNLKLVWDTLSPLISLVCEDEKYIAKPRE